MAKILITGANGWIGYNVRLALKNHNLILVDKHQGNDANNRFGIENVEPTPEPLIINKMDLIKERKAFDDLVSTHKPDCVIHLAGILETQSAAAIHNNLKINKNVLEVCANHNINVIAASSIMAMYGAAISHPKISRIMARECIALEENEKLTTDVPFNNTEQTIKKFDPNNWQQFLEYIACKEEMEKLAKQLVALNPELTIIAVRFGWTGIKNPYELEGTKSNTEVPGYLCQEDLQSFISKLVSALLAKNVTGYRCYAPTSLHPQNWASIKNAESDLDWQPNIHVIEKFQPLPAQHNSPSFSP